MVTLICDDDSVFRRAVARNIDGTVLHAGDIESALTLVENYKPNVVLLDTMLPDGIGYLSIPEITVRSPHTKVIVLTAFGSRADGLRATGEFRALAYLSKDEGVQTIKKVWLRAFMASLVECVRARWAPLPSERRPCALASPPRFPPLRRRRVS